MEFGQLIEYNMRNIFLEKLHTKFGGDTIPRPLSRKSKLGISLGYVTIGYIYIYIYIYIYSLFLFFAKSRTIELC